MKLSYQKSIDFLNKFGLVAIVIFAVLIKLYLLVLHDYVIADDGILYISEAKSIVANGIHGFSPGMFNLFPFLIAILYSILNVFVDVSYETTGLLITSICGVGIIIPLYLLAKDYFGNPAAIITGIYLCLLPELTEISCSVLREAPALCLIAWSIFFFLKAIRSNDPQEWNLIKLALAGLLIIVAGMIRLEMFVFAGVFVLTMLLAYLWPLKPYRTIKRFKSILAFTSVFIIIGAVGITTLSIKAKSFTLGPLDRIFAQNGLGEIKVKQDPFEIDKNLLYDADGKIRPHVRIRYQFTDLAHDHRRYLFMFEIAYKHWKAVHMMGIIMLAAGLFALIRYRRLNATNPLSLISFFSLAIFWPVFYIYVSSKFYLGTRHVLALTLPLSLIMGVWANYVIEYNKYVKLLVLIFVIAWLTMFGYKSFKPIRGKKLPQKICGLQLAEYLPTNAVVFASTALRPAVFYSDAKYRLFALNQPAEKLKTRLTKTSNRYLLINNRKISQEQLAPISNILTKVNIDLEVDKKIKYARKYNFSLYIAKESEK